jgi:pimeloyl-ACP methyl ester carboxylesterase
VECRGRKAIVEVTGEGEAIVFCGAAAPMAWTRPAALALADLGYRVVNFDYGSGHETPELRTSLDQVYDVEAAMDAAAVSTAVAVGLSRGAITAYGMAGASHDRAKAVVLVFPVAGFGDTLLVPGPDRGGEDEGDTDPDIGRIAARIFSEGFLEERMEDAVALLTTTPGSVWRVDRRKETPFPDDLSVRCPVLVVEAGSDAIVGQEHPARYLVEHPGAGHVVVDDASHGWVMEDPHAFAGIVDDFVRTRVS